MYRDRLTHYAALEKARGSRVLTYVTGDRKNLETQIHGEVVDFIINHLDTFDYPKKISLFLYTKGGDTLAGWTIVNLLRQFCKELEVIVPAKCHSTGTLMCLGANRIVMTKQATLGPIDPSVNTPLNPQIPGNPTARFPVSVEAIKGFIELTQNELQIKPADSDKILVKLMDFVHPLVLGQVFRAKGQIQMLAEKLIKNQVSDKEKIRKIIAFLVSESGSHDYTITRREARDTLGLSIETPTQEIYDIIKAIYDDIRTELELNIPFDSNQIIGGNSNLFEYKFRRAIVESVGNGSEVFVSEGKLVRRQAQIQPGIIQNIIEDQRLSEGWRHEN